MNRRSRTDAPDEVRLGGELALVTKIERLAAEFKDQVIKSLSVLLASHANKIGCDGSVVLGLQKRTGVTFVLLPLLPLIPEQDRYL